MISFPKDHAQHDCANEWWYFDVVSRNNKKSLFSLTLFRIDIKKSYVYKGKLRFLPLKNLYALYFSCKDKDGFSYRSKIHFLSSIKNYGLDVRIGKTRIFEYGGNIVVENVFGKNLRLEFSTRNVLLHGKNGRISMDGRGYSNYYSIIDTSASFFFENKKEKAEVWFDHQWGDWFFDRDCWDWFGLILDNDVQIMVYNFFDKNRRQLNSTITVKQGRKQSVLGKLRVKELSYWKSPGSYVTYPIKWLLEFKNFKLVVSAVIKNSEVKTLGAIFWKGHCKVEGFCDNKRVKGFGFMELVGYEHFVKGDFCEEYTRI